MTQLPVTEYLCKINRTGGTSGAGTDYPSVTPAVTPVFLKYGSYCSIFNFLCSILLTIVCSSCVACLQITTSDYPFDIFITRVKNHTFPKIEDKIVVLEESLGISHNRKTVSSSSCFDVFTDSVNIHIIIQNE